MMHCLGIMDCTVLHRASRNHNRLVAGRPVRLTHRTGSPEFITTLMAVRTGHSMPLAELHCQFATQAPPGPDEALTNEVDQLLQAIMKTCIPEFINGASTCAIG